MIVGWILQHYHLQVESVPLKGKPLEERLTTLVWWSLHGFEEAFSKQLQGSRGTCTPIELFTSPALVMSFITKHFIVLRPFHTDAFITTRCPLRQL